MKKIATTLALSGVIAFSALAQVGDVAPTTINGKYYLNFADISLEVDPAVGGRITSFKLGTAETQKKKLNGNDNDFGSSLQPAPQSLWNWPPPPNIDNQPYTASIDSNKIMLVGKEETSLKLSVMKKISVSSSDTSIIIEYIIKNTDSKPKSISGWEVTKINSGGLIFYPLGTGSATDLAKWTTSKNGIVWYDHDSAKVTTNKGGSFRSDGAEGWYANVQNSGVVFIKKFKDTPADKQAPGENEIKMFIRDDNSYLSYELQGPYTSIPANSTANWKVKWYLRKLPSTVKATAQNDALVGFVKSVVNRSITAVENQESAVVTAIIVPQPILNEFSLKLDHSKYTIVDVLLFDTNGKNVRKYSNINSNDVLQKGELQKGIYTYSILSNGVMVGKGKISIE
ncbi:MAG: hypothetical protein EAZ07_02055 [Cytophagales bacterium]|nr:MAG: hypothetical protein EAZ07_02055 [Cytophagales bacterium]